MIVKINDEKKFANENGYIGDITESIDYEIIAIIQEKNVFKYLIRRKNVVELIDSKYFNVIDDKIPDYWIFKNFGYNHKIKNMLPDYMFTIIIDTYLGPKELIEDENFFFDVMVEKSKAEETLYRTLLKYGKEWKTPSQT